MNRRKVQNANRSANKFGLKPFVPTLRISTQGYVSQMTQHVRGAVAVVMDTIPADQVIDVDAIVEGTNRLIDDLKASKPKNWPWNKKLPCCNQIEKNCACGSGRIYMEIGA